MKVTSGAKRKLRDLVDQARLARAMQREVYERQKELGEDLMAAQREFSLRRSRAERLAWNRQSTAPVNTTRDRKKNANIKVAKLRARLDETNARLSAAKEQFEALMRPLDKIAEHIGLLELVDAAPDTLRQLEEFAS